MSEQKICINCKWCGHKEKTWWDKITFRYVEPAEFAKCRHPLSKTILQKEHENKILVDGIDRREYTYCAIMRGKYLGGKLCGPDGELFEPKEQ